MIFKKNRITVPGALNKNAMDTVSNPPGQMLFFLKFYFIYKKLFVRQMRKIYMQLFLLVTEGILLYLKMTIEY